MQYVITCFLFLCILGNTLIAIEYDPWYGSLYEVHVHGAFSADIYDSIAVKDGSFHRSSCDTFYELGVSGVPEENYAVELDFIGGKAKGKTIGWNAILLTGRKKWFNDILGDPVSFSTGITVSQVFKPGLRNLSAYYHGGIQGEVHLSFGKEKSISEFWVSRFFCMLGCGVADIGYPWLRSQTVWSHNWWNNHQFQLFLNGLWGFGPKSLHPGHFRGYGNIHHQSIDLGLSYRYLFDIGLNVELSYSYRCFAKNCPQNVNAIMCMFEYPFGL